MKSLIVLATLLSAHAFAETVTCRSDIAIQRDQEKPMSVNSELSFTLNRETKEITKVVGHIFVQSPYESGDISTENSYMGFYSVESVKANPDYRPRRYKGYTQFKDFDALHTAGLESGMWGDLVLDLSKTDKFDARYIFQAGDHMGGTVIFSCRSQKE